MNGLPVTITDPNMSRYFMTIPEAAGLVIESAICANNSNICVLDMGEPINIVELVQRYVKMTNQKTPKIIITGIRSGEKLSEDLFDRSEYYRGTSHPRIRVVDVSPDLVSEGQFNTLYHCVDRGSSTTELLVILGNLIAQVRDKQTVPV
jgi:FlaA1/EpsC-like NDP-sugar epimerase